MRSLALATCFILAGCAASSASLYRKPVAETIQSAKSPAAWATCAAELMRGNTEIRNEGADHYWILRHTQSEPWHRWDFTRTATGSQATRRSVLGVNTGVAAVRECA